MQGSIRNFDRLFSSFVFVTIALLAAYMILRIGVAGYNFFEGATRVFWSDYDLFLSESHRRALQGIAETVILVKAYRILVSYLRTHHISVEYIVEISIIAPAIELIFAHDMYKTETLVIMGVFGLANLFFYLQYFHPDHDEELHHTMRGRKE